MLKLLPAPIIFVLSFSLFALNLLFCGTFVTLSSLLRIVLPFLKQPLSASAHFFYGLWAKLNGIIITSFNPVSWHVNIHGQVSQQQWYLLIANHLSWLDILVLTSATQHHLPAAKFFLKDELKYVPFVGSSAWALDMPFMKRYSRATLAKKPHLKGKDIEATRKSCHAFMHRPTTIINFVEGTRFTEKKHAFQHSPFKHLLKPKAGGIAFTLQALGDKFDAILNTTLLYPDNSGHVMRDMLTGRLQRIVVTIRQEEVSPELLGDYFNDEQHQVRFQQWLNQRWQEKDQQIEVLLHARSEPIKQFALSEQPPRH